MKFPIITTCVVVLSACAGSNAARQSRDAEPGRDADVILPEELSGINGSTSMTPYDNCGRLDHAKPATAVLQAKPGPADGLRRRCSLRGRDGEPADVPAQVRRVGAYFSPGNAEARFGPGHLLGAIESLPRPVSRLIPCGGSGVRSAQERRYARALRFFAERRIKVHFVDLNERAASVAELRRFAQKFGVGALMDRESRRFGELGLGAAMLSEERWLEKLSIEPLLLRMPLVRNQQQLTIGAAQEIWNAWYAAAKS